MAAVDNVTRSQDVLPGMETVRVQLTGATSTYESERFGTVTAFVATVEGTNATTYTISGNTITITGTNNDFVNLVLYGS